MPGEISSISSPLFVKPTPDDVPTKTRQHHVSNDTNNNEEISTTTTIKSPVPPLVVPKSLSAHDCLIGVTQEHLLPRQHYHGASTLASASSKPRGWYATRKAYRSVAYKTWTVGGARKLLNGSASASAVVGGDHCEGVDVVGKLPTSASATIVSTNGAARCSSSSPVGPKFGGGLEGSVSDSEEKYYSAMEEESDFETECPVAGCGGNNRLQRPRKCVSTEIFYQASSSSSIPNVHNINCNNVNTDKNGNNNISNSSSYVDKTAGTDKSNIIRFLCTEPSTSTLACSRTSSLNNNGLDAAGYSSTLNFLYTTSIDNASSSSTNVVNHVNGFGNNRRINNNNKQNEIRPPKGPNQLYSDQEDQPTDCFSSEDYCRYQKRNGLSTVADNGKCLWRPQLLINNYHRNNAHRLARSFDAIDYEPDDEICIDLDEDDCEANISNDKYNEQEIRTVIDTFQDLKNLRKKQLFNNKKLSAVHPTGRSRSPLAITSQTLIRKLQQVLPNLHINGKNGNGRKYNNSSNKIDLLAPQKCYDPGDIIIDNIDDCDNTDNGVIIDKGDLYRQVSTEDADNNSGDNEFGITGNAASTYHSFLNDGDKNCNGDDSAIFIDQSSGFDNVYEDNNGNLNYANLSFANSLDAWDYLKNEFISIREKDFAILKQLQQVEQLIRAQKPSSTSEFTQLNVPDNNFLPNVSDGRYVIPVPKCLLLNNLI